MMSQPFDILNTPVYQKRSRVGIKTRDYSHARVNYTNSELRLIPWTSPGSGEFCIQITRVHKEET